MRNFIATMGLILLLAGCGTQRGQLPTAVPAELSTAIKDEKANRSLERHLDIIATDYVRALSEGNYRKALDEYAYDATMRGLINESVLKDQIWGLLTTKYGAFKEIVDATSQDQNGFTVIGVRTSFEKASLLINVIFDKEGKSQASIT